MIYLQIHLLKNDHIFIALNEKKEQNLTLSPNFSIANTNMF
jgi:hypothetical protein